MNKRVYPKITVLAENDNDPPGPRRMGDLCRTSVRPS